MISMLVYAGFSSRVTKFIITSIKWAEIEYNKNVIYDAGVNVQHTFNKYKLHINLHIEAQTINFRIQSPPLFVTEERLSR